MGLTDEQLAELVRLIEATADAEIDCAEMLERVAPYMKALVEDESQTAYLRSVAQHMRVCPECEEEFLALIEAEGLDRRAVLGDESAGGRV